MAIGQAPPGHGGEGPAHRVVVSAQGTIDKGSTAGAGDPAEAAIWGLLILLDVAVAGSTLSAIGGFHRRDGLRAHAQARWRPTSCSGASRASGPVGFGTASSGSGTLAVCVDASRSSSWARRLGMPERRASPYAGPMCAISASSRFVFGAAKRRWIVVP